MSKRSFNESVIECPLCGSDSVYSLSNGASVKCQNCGRVWSGLSKYQRHRHCTRVLANMRKYYLAHYVPYSELSQVRKEASRASSRRYRFEHKEELALYHSEYRKDRLGLFAERQKLFYLRHKVSEV